MSGWVRIHRGVFDHGLFADEPMSEREAWLWLIAKAAWKDTTHRVGSAMTKVDRGSMFVTLRDLQAAWRWKSDTRVRGFLELLEAERMILRVVNAGKTQITICNYVTFQDDERTENAQKTQEKRTENALKEEGKKLRKEDSSLRSLSSAGEPSIFDEPVLPEAKPAKVTPRQALEAAIGPELATAVIEHRKAMKKPLTTYAAELLVKGFQSTGDPKAAAKMMIERVWVGFRLEWYKNELHRQANGSQQDQGSGSGRSAHATRTGGGRREPPSVAAAFARAGGVSRDRALVSDGGDVLFDPGSAAETQPGITIDGITGARVH